MKSVVLSILVLAWAHLAFAQPLISQDKTNVTASSVQLPNYPTNANDGIIGLATNRWAAADGTYPQWWRVDLESTQAISQVVVYWYNSVSRAYKYQIEISDDDVNYTVLVDNTGNSTFGDTTNTVSATARFVRVYVTGVTAAGGFASFYECQIFGASSPLLPAAPTGLAATGTNSIVKLNWVQSVTPAVITNRVYRSTTGGGGPYNLLASLPATTTYSDAAVVNGQIYYYVVTAVSTNGESANSSFVSVTPQPPGNEPTITDVSPTTNSTVGTLTQITVTFSSLVVGVNASDLLINGQPASNVIGGSGTNIYIFQFTQPAPGTVSVTWDSLHGITELSGTPFNAAAPGATWNYTLADTVPPQVADTTPLPGVKIAHLTQVEISFTETVLGVNASDLLINNQPATSVTGSGAGPYVFHFTQPPAGPVQFAWAGGHGITDAAAIPNAFAGGSWSNTLDTVAGTPTVRINEFLTANVNTNGLRDEFGNLEDWIELYNFGASAVDLAGCSLTDDPNLPGKWVFPSVILGPNQYLVVFASGRDRKIVGGANKLHTSFSLDTGGEYLGLFNAESPRAPLDVFSPAYPEQRMDISFGRDSVNALRYFDTPTPGALNGNSTITGVVEPVHFTVGRGFFNQPFTLLLTTPTPGATIRYTTDGSPPTDVTGSIYNSALTVSNTTTLRAAGFKTDLLPTLVKTHTYIFVASVLNQRTNPPGFPLTGSWGNGGPDYEMDPKVVTNPAYSATIQGDLLSLPTLSLVMTTDDMFGPANGVYSHVSGTQEAACSMELIYPDGTKGVQIDAGVEMHGGGSRTGTRKHSLGIKFRGKYGYGQLQYQFFPDSPVEAFDSLVLHADYNNHWVHSDATQRPRGGLVRDALIKDAQAAMGSFSSHSRYVHLYINGLYWGVYNPCEDLDNHFAAAYFGGDGDEYDCTRQGDTPTYSGDPNHVAYNTLLTFNNSGLASAGQYAQLQQYLDVVQYADYLILQHYAANRDWGTTKNWAAVRKREAGAQFKYLPWDNERTLEGNTDDVVSASPNGFQDNLILNSEYKILFADRIHKHLFNDGALTTNAIAQLWKNRADEIYRAMVAESARWGDVASATLYTRDGQWLAEQARLLTNYFPARTAILLNQYRAKGYYPAIDAPEFNQHGGRVAAGFNVTLSAPAGTIYFTTNGVDPRVPITGTISPQAGTYTGTPIALNGSRLIKARVLSGGTWSALTEAQFTVGDFGVPLRITELMYNPIGGSQYEFLELQNLGSTPLDISGFSFEGITFVFPQGTILAPGAVALLANNTSPSEFSNRYPGALVSGYFGGSLDNGGERIAILDASGNTVTAVNYDDAAGWPTSPDGGGYSLEVIDPRDDPDAPSNWRASSAINGTPGLPPVAPALGNIVINEIAADNAGSVTNGGLFPDWIELQNRGSSATNLAGWSLTDDSNARKYVLPSTNIPAGGYLVVWCDTATNAPGLHAGFSLGRNGETVSLFNASTSRVDAITFGLQLTDKTLGRIGDEWRLSTPTPNATNVAVTLASSTNVALNEWLANPPPATEDWLELFNRSSNAPVALRGLYLSTSNTVFQIRNHSFLAPRGYVQLFADELPGPDHLNFKLPAAGGAIVLSDGTALELERVTYGTQAQSVTHGRLPDGTANITSFPGSASPGATNYLLAWSGPLLNEILARNDRAELAPWNAYVDWIEIYNPSNGLASLAGLALGKSTAPSDRWTFPAGVTIPALGYLRVWCDGSRGASTNSSSALNTGFALSGDSGDVYLFNTAGQPVDLVSYGFQLQDMTIGRSGGLWKLLASPTPGAVNSVAATLGSVTSLRLNEWMASPLSGDNWFELYNTNPSPVALDGLFLTDDPSIVGLTQFQIAPLSFIDGRKWVKWEADGHPGNGRNHVNFSLDHAGETLRLYNASTNLIDAVDFAIQDSGVSQGRLPDGAANIVSFPTTPTPGEANYLPLASVIINEILTHTDPPLEDAIELFNPTAGGVNIGGWYLSDSPSDLKRYRIPDGTTIPAGGFVVFYQNQFGPADGETDIPPLFTFNSAHGDGAYVSQADGGSNLTGYRAGITFAAAANGVSFGRYQTSVGVDFVPMSQRTFGMDQPTTLAQFRTGTGTNNAYPLVGPIVFSEIMYHPPDYGTNTPDLEEFIELQNITSTNVPLFDPAYPSNVWHLVNAVGFDFPTNTIIPAGGRLVIVPFNPATDPAALAIFRSRYGTNATLVGPYSGKLDNAGESLELWRPDAPQIPPHPDAGFVPQLLVERVTYSDAAPWPTNADGFGPSLQRLVGSNYGNDPVNWRALLPTAGLPNLVAPTGVATLPGNGVVRLTFAVQPGLTCQVEYKNNQTNATWLPLGSPIIATNNILIVDDNLNSQPQRFYRLSILP